MPQSALIVDDDRTQRRMVVGVLQNRLHLETLEAESGEQCVETLDEDTKGLIKLVVLDLDMPSINGLETLKIINRRYPKLPVIVLTGSTHMDDAVQAMKAGALDFLSKPASPERIMISVRNALKISLMAKEITRLKKKSENALSFSDLTGHDKGLAASISAGRKAASCDFPVLVTGETGTGKEVFAQAVHGESSRGGRAFIAVNCGAIPEKLVESTLFGHEKGAFTGAVSKAPGKFLEAHEGTIFLDEVGELLPEAQVKLLRVLQQGEIEPVGAARPVPVNVRVISATNRDLAEEVRTGRFRQDLYFRLNVLHINLPPLRERKGDIPELAAHFIHSFCAAHQQGIKELAPLALTRLFAHAWPGNVRELENVINRAMILREGDRLEEHDFSLVSAAMAGSALIEGLIMPLDGNGALKPLNILEQEIIRVALAHHGNNIAQAARALGIAKSTLYTKLGHMADRL